MRAWVGRQRLAAHALGAAGGARRVDHAGSLRQRRALPRALAREPGLPVGRAGRHVTGCRAGCRRRRRISGGVSTTSTLTPAGMASATPASRSACATSTLAPQSDENVGDLLGLEVPVDRHGVGAEPHGRQRGLQEREIVAQQQRGAVAPLETQPREARGRAQPRARRMRPGQAARSPLTRRRTRVAMCWRVTADMDCIETESPPGRVCPMGGL